MRGHTTPGLIAMLTMFSIVIRCLALEVGVHCCFGLRSGWHCSLCRFLRVYSRTRLKTPILPKGQRQMKSESLPRRKNQLSLDLQTGLKPSPLCCRLKWAQTAGLRSPHRLGFEAG